MIQIPLITEVDLSDKVVLIRVDHNVVEKGVIKDAFRLERSKATIDYVLGHGGFPILMSHFGRPRDKKTGNIIISPEENADPIIEYMKEKWGLNVALVKVDATNAPPKGLRTLPETVNDAIAQMKRGKVQAVYLPNTRWFEGEESKGVPRESFARELSGLAGIYVYDAFGSWQPHASTFDVTRHLPSYAGLLVQEEVEKLEAITNPKKPFLAVVAGEKIDTKIGSIRALCGLADYVILGGLPYNAIICAKYGISINGVGQEEIEAAKQILQEDRGQGKLLHPRYVVESDVEGAREDGKYREIDLTTLKRNQKLNFVYDVATRSFEDERIRDAIASAQTIFINAVMGFDKAGYVAGTRALFEAIAHNTDADKYLGGGDTLSAFQKLTPKIYKMAIKDSRYFLFTGGGTILTAIEEGGPYELPTIKALIESRERTL